MKFLPLVWAALFHRKIRTLLTLCSVFVAFLLFGLLDGARIAFNPVSSSAGAHRMFTISRFSSQGLPSNLADGMAGVPDVKRVTWASFIGGYFQEPQSNFATYAVEKNFFDLYPDYAITLEQDRAFRRSPTAAIAGQALASRLNWKVGDRIPIRNTLVTHSATGTPEWVFDLVGIFSARDDRQLSDENSLMVRWDYLDEARASSTHSVQMIISEIAPAASHDGAAERIDALFANSDHESVTMTEQALNRSYFRQFGDIGLIVSAIMTAVFFTLLLLTGNVMAHGVRERTPQLGALKTLGFSDSGVLALVLAESVLLIVLGGVGGLSLASLAMPWLSRGGSPIPLATLSAQTWLTGFIIMLAVGFAVGTWPALRAMRLQIVDALAHR